MRWLRGGIVRCVLNNEKVDGKNDGNNEKNQAAYSGKNDGVTTGFGRIGPVHGLLLCEEARLG
jgi:hypothetical protein